MERIMTLHPDPKKAGVHIEKQKYNTMRVAILASIGEHGEITFNDLTADVRTRLAGQFDGSIAWYVTSVKLDLEARGLIQRVPKSRPQRIHLA